MGTLTDSTGLPSRTASTPARSRGWRIAWALLLIAAGALAVLMPGIAALATATLLAWLLVLAGVFELAYAAHTRQRPGLGWKVASGIVTLLLGIAIAVLPLAGILSLALLVGAFLLVGGIARIVLASRLRPVRGWGWVLADGVTSVIVGILIGIGWPGNSIAIIGLLTGLSLIASGVWRLLLRDDDRA